MIRHLFVDAEMAENARARQIAGALGLPLQIVDHQNLMYDSIKSSSDPWEMGKHVLWLTRNKGAFLRKCPGTRDYLCCGYHILHFGAYCTMDCAYCILQSYFHPPVLRYFLNQEDLFRELEEAFDSCQTLRIGTGEFTDSLIWESWTNFNPELIKLFARQNSAVLELKTKTTAIEHLYGLQHHRKTILSWSLNTPRVIASQERGTASLQARLRAAARAHSWGYPIALHFDPLVIYPGCVEEYKSVIASVFEHLPPEAIVWISMGAFRFMPALQPIIKKRFPDSDIIYGEFITGLDGKMRYFKPMRIDLIKSLVQAVKKAAPEVLVYLCMEDEQVWQESFGFSPQTRGGLAAMLDDSARRHCGIQ